MTRPAVHVRVLRHHRLELIAYLDVNCSALVNYGSHHRCGELISTALSPFEPAKGAILRLQSAMAVRRMY
jgi:hypothetical protein